MSDRILFVDDEIRVLDGMVRLLSDTYEIETASSGDDGLKKIQSQAPFAVVISDMRMPGMNGATFLKHVYETTPQSTRVLLTGYSDVREAIDAVNHGHIFRFLSKPCSEDAIRLALQDSLRQYQLVQAEKVLLEGTLCGSVRVLSEVLALASPIAFGRAGRIKKLASAIALLLRAENRFEIEIAAMLSQLGCVAVPERILKLLPEGIHRLNEEEFNCYQQHPAVAARLLAEIPRMRSIAAIVGSQQKNFDGTGLPNDGLAGDSIPLGSRILKVVTDFELQTGHRVAPGLALDRMAREPDKYDVDIVDALRQVTKVLETSELVELPLDSLQAGLILEQDIVAKDGLLMVARGQELTDSLIARLKMYGINEGISQPIVVSKCFAA